MNHLTPLQLSMLADNALPADEVAVLTEHVEACATCQANLAAARNEAELLTSALQVEVADAPEVVVPKFSRSLSLRDFVLANLATGLVIWLGQFLWRTLFGELIVNATTWVTSVYLPDIYAMTSAAALYWLEEGTAMFDAYLGYVIFSLLAVTAVWLLLKYRARAATGACLLVVAAGASVVSDPANALELRRDKDTVTVAKSETIDDTLLVAAETVLIEGDIAGDLVAAGNRIDVLGSVGGNLITFAESVTVRGKVGGLALGAAETYDLRGATVGGDLWVAGENVGIDQEARVGRNLTVASETVSVEGAVAKDLHAFAETVELSGVLGEDLEAFTEQVRLLGSAQVGGDLRFRSGSEDRLHRAETAQVTGNVEFLDLPEVLDDRSRYATVEFYLWQVARLISAFLVGMAFLWAAAGFRSVSIGAGVDALKTAGVGFLWLLGVPIAAILVAFTLVGVPLSLIAVAAWMVAIYLAKIVVAAFVGRMLLRDSESLPATLLAGLAAVIVAVNLPFIGGFISFILTIIGLGLIVQYLIAALPPRSSGDLAQA